MFAKSHLINTLKNIFNIFSVDIFSRDEAALERTLCCSYVLMSSSALHMYVVILHVSTCGWVVAGNRSFRDNGTIVCLNREAYSRPSLPTLGTLLNEMKWSFEISNTDLYLSPLKG